MMNNIQKTVVMTIFITGLAIIFFPLFTKAPNLKSKRLLAVPSTELPLPTGPLTVENQESCDCECNKETSVK